MAYRSTIDLVPPNGTTYASQLDEFIGGTRPMWNTK